MERNNVLNLKNYKTLQKQEHRSTYNAYHQRIWDAIIEHFKEYKVIPTNVQLSEKLKISPKTLVKHRKEINYDLLKPEYKQLTPKVMQSLLAKCLSGNVQAIRLWMQIVEGFGLEEKKDEMTNDAFALIQMTQNIINMSVEEREKRLNEIQSKTIKSIE